MAEDKAPNLQTDPATREEEETVHHISRRSKRDMEPASMQLNLTSMIDVIFQLLIYFVVTASFTVGEGVITAKLPQGSGDPSTSPKPPETPLNIILTDAGVSSYRIQIDNFPSSPTTFTELQEVLIANQLNPELGRTGNYKPDNPVIIKPNGQVRWAHVVNAFNAAVAARYSNVSFAQASE